MSRGSAAVFCRWLSFTSGVWNGHSLRELRAFSDYVAARTRQHGPRPLGVEFFWWVGARERRPLTADAIYQAHQVCKRRDCYDSVITTAWLPFSRRLHEAIRPPTKRGGRRAQRARASSSGARGDHRLA